MDIQPPEKTAEELLELSRTDPAVSAALKLYKAGKYKSLEDSLAVSLHVMRETCEELLNMYAAAERKVHALETKNSLYLELLKIAKGE
jgi:hypothetical protein